jgi:hypothetical protein
MSFEHTDVGDWVCDDHNKQLFWLRGRFRCTETHEGISERAAWVQPQEWAPLSPATRTRDQAFLVLQNGLVLRNRMVPWRDWTEADRGIDAMREHNGHRSAAVKYWHMFVDQSSLLGRRPNSGAYVDRVVLGPMYADADAVYPPGTRPVRIGMASVPGRPHDVDGTWWAWLASYNFPPSAAVRRSRIDVLLAEQELALANARLESVLRSADATV